MPHIGYKPNRPEQPSYPVISRGVRILGFWENITGHTLDGWKADQMPDNVKLVFSIKNHLNQLLNIRKGSVSHLPDMGMDDIPDVLRAVPTWIAQLEKSLKEMLLKYETRAKDIYIYAWHIRKDLSCLACKIILVLRDNRVIRLKAIFAGAGNNLVQLATSDEQES